MPVNCDDPTEVENAAQAALIRKLADALLVVRDALTAAREAGMAEQPDAERALRIAKSWVGGPGRIHALSADIEKHFATIRGEARAEHKDRIEDLERRLADANGHVAALKAALATRRSACNEASKRAHEAERQIAELRAALGSAVVGLQDVFPRNTLTNAALADVRAALERTRDLSHGLVYPRSPTTGNGDEP
jgi:chromosome segregation ATPase